jgi:hypothetical protein
VPPFCPITPADQHALEHFETAVLEHLFALNAKRAHDEALRGLSTKPAKTPKAKPPAKKTAATKSSRAPRKPPRRPKGDPEGHLSLGSDEET